MLPFVRFRRAGTEFLTDPYLDINEEEHADAVKALIEKDDDGVVLLHQMFLDLLPAAPLHENDKPDDEEHATPPPRTPEL